MPLCDICYNLFYYDTSNHECRNIFLGFDPGTFLNQLNNLQANQIDDLESALLPHLHGNFTHLISYIIYGNKILIVDEELSHEKSNILIKFIGGLSNNSQVLETVNGQSQTSQGISNLVLPISSSDTYPQQAHTVIIKQQPQEQDESHDEIRFLRDGEGPQRPGLLTLGLEEGQLNSNPFKENTFTSSSVKSISRENQDISKFDKTRSHMLDMEAINKPKKKNEISKDGKQDTRASMSSNQATKEVIEKGSNSIKICSNNYVPPSNSHLEHARDGRTDVEASKRFRGEKSKPFLEHGRDVRLGDQSLSSTDQSRINHGSITRLGDQSLSSTISERTHPSTSKRPELSVPLKLIPRITIAQLGGLTSVANTSSMNVISPLFDRSRDDLPASTTPPLQTTLAKAFHKSPLKDSRKLIISPTNDFSAARKINAEILSINQKSLEANNDEISNQEENRFDTSTPKRNRNKEESLNREEGTEQIDDLRHSLNDTLPSSGDISGACDRSHDDGLFPPSDNNEEIGDDGQTKTVKSSKAASRIPLSKKRGAKVGVVAPEPEIGENKLPPADNMHDLPPFNRGAAGGVASGDEIKVALNSVNKGQSFKFCIPGTSRSVTLNFSADALAKMRSSVTSDSSTTETRANALVSEPNIESSTLTNDTSQDEVSSSTNIDEVQCPEKEKALEANESVPGVEEVDNTQPVDDRENNEEDDTQKGDDEGEQDIPAQSFSVLRSSKRRMERGNKKNKKKRESQKSPSELTDSKSKGGYQCQLCSKQYPSKRLLEKHVVFHVDQNTACSVCGKVFLKRWMLEEHLAVDHRNSDKTQSQGNLHLINLAYFKIKYEYRFAKLVSFKYD